MKTKRKIRLLTGIMVLLFTVLYVAGCGSTSDGEYTASAVLRGGSGKAYIENPCKVIVENNRTKVHIRWSSANYDYMVVDGETYYPVNSEGNSEFIIPVELDKEMTVYADTTAMSTPHLIEYTLLITVQNSDQDNSADITYEEKNGDALEIGNPPDIQGLEYLSTDENIYATSFSIHRYSDGYAVIAVDDGRKYFIVPQGKTAPENVSDDFIIINQIPQKIYLAASSVMCHFDALDCVDTIALSGLEKKSWYIEAAAKAMDEGRLQYGGKYSAPDYEKIVMDNIDLVIENTMILHVPKVLEKLEQLGVPVFIDKSSYEQEPLGRCEWIKVYGLITGKEKEAEELFSAQKKIVDTLDNGTKTGRTVAIFSINSNHQIVTKKSTDYFAKMVEMAGGTYLSPSQESTSSQMTISIEAFYDYAEEADILIYNATIEDAPENLGSLAGGEKVLADFKAFKEKNIYYTDKALYQFASKTGSIIDDLNSIISKNAEDTGFFHKIGYEEK